MATVTLIENDIAAHLKTLTKAKALEMPKALKFKITLDVDSDAYKALDDDPLLLAKMTEAASDDYKAMLKAVAKQIITVDKAIGKVSDPQKQAAVLDKLNKNTKTALAGFSKSGKEAAEKAWAEVAKTKSEYTKYKVKAGVDLAIDGLNVGLGIASAVGSGGFALIIGIYGIIKTLVSAAMKIYKLAIDADKMQKKVKKGLEKVQKSFNKKKREVSGAKETGKAFVNSLLGSDFLPTIDGVKKDNDQYKSKIQGVDVASHALAKKLNEVLKEIDKIQKDSDVKGNKKIAALVDKMQKQTAKLIDKVIDMQERVTEGTEFQETTAKAIKELETLEPKKWKIIQKGLPLIDIVLAGGDFSETASTLQDVGIAAASEITKQGLDKV